MINKQQLVDIVADVKYLDWRWRVLDKGDGFLIQLAWNAPCCVTGKVKEHHGRKWYVSVHSTVSEVVAAAWAAVERAVLHEARENFTYKGRRILDPHVDAEALVELADSKRLDARKDHETTPALQLQR